MSTSKPRVDGQTAQAIVSNLAAGLKPFLATARTILRNDNREIYDAAVAAVSRGEAVETVMVTISDAGLVASLVLLDPRSSLPQPLFSMSAKRTTGGEPDEQIPYALLH